MTQIAFTRLGLRTLGVSEATGDARLDAGAMRNDKPELGDGGPWDPIYDSKQIHGVLLICTKSKASITPEHIPS